MHTALFCNNESANLGKVGVILCQGSRSHDKFAIWHFSQNNTEEAKHALVGKVTPNQMARTALSEFSNENETEEESYVSPPSQIVVKEGGVVEVILEQAAEKECDLIVMGASEGLLSSSSVGSNIKSVLKNSKIPVLVVPAEHE
jgi:nucleotide-binding universal stress UspA family protein